MKRFISVLSAVIITIMSLFSQAPDFAFPRKVEQKASRDLAEALAAGNGDKVVNALIRLGLAQSAISADSIPAVIADIERVRDKENDMATAAMLSLLEANIYTSVYCSDRWTIDRRGEVDVAEYSSDYTLWGKEQFTRKVLGLLSDALSHPEALREIPLTDYTRSIDYERDALTFYPTMLDFVASRAIRYLTDGFLASGNTFSMELLRNPSDTALFPSASASPVERFVLDAYSLLMNGRETTAPGMHALACAMNFIAPRVFEFERPVFAFRSEADPSADVQRIFLDTYRRYMSVPYAVDLLLRMPSLSVSSAIAPEVYAALREFEKNDPGYFNIDGVRKLVATLSARAVSLTAPEVVAKGVPFKVDVTATNLNSVILKLYKLADGAVSRDASSYSGVLPKNTACSDSVRVAGAVPFRANAAATLTAPDYGRYVIVAEADGLERPRSCDIINCSDLAAAVVQPRDGGAAKAVVFDAVGGAPVPGASLMFTSWDRREAPRALQGTTASDGFLSVDVQKSGNIYPVLGTDRFARTVSVYSSSSPDLYARICGEMVTSLGLYRPGDTMEFAAVVYELSERGRMPLAGRTFNVMLRDANYQEVGRTALTTDAWGRARGSFELPASGLTGLFQLQFADNDISGSSYFMVSDYKLPTFEVNVTSTTRPAALGDDAVVEGIATTFAGFPVEGAVVKAQLRVRTGAWWFATTSPVFYQAEAIADAKGEFRIVVPGSVIVASPCAQGYFLADIAVTSPDGETRTASAGFNMGKPCYIAATMASTFCADSSDEAKVQLLDYDGKSREAELLYKICKASAKAGSNPVYSSEIVAEGSMMPGSFATVLSSLPSGNYGVVFTTADPSLADPTPPAMVTVWRPSDSFCAADRLLWLPKQDVVADEAGKASFMLGTNAPGHHILMIVSDMKGGVVETRWIDSKPMQTVYVQIPSGASTGLNVTLSAVDNCNISSATVNVEPASSRSRIEVRVSTFRDKVVPGDNEIITLSVSGIQGASPESAVMLDMSNKAIDVLHANPFSLSPEKWHGVSPSINFPYFGQRWMSFSGRFPDYESVSFAVPEFRLYGRSFMAMRNLGSVRIRGSRVMMADMATESAEAAVEDQATMVVEHKMAYSAGAVTTKNTMSDSDAGAIEESAAGGAVGGDAQQSDNAVYRPAEMPLAFFRPMLTTDTTGNLDITYTVPDANTTWVLRALAYNRSLLTSSDKVEIMASKPLMVSSNPTRFLRCGDRVVLPASVMNAADSTVVATTLCELVDITEGDKVLASSVRTDTIVPGGRVVASVEFDVPQWISGVIFRVRSTAGRFTDGEQSFIPVLPSEQNVVEATRFYINPGENHFTMPLPAVGNGRAYLRYDGNPAWEVVSALAGLRDTQFTSSVDAAGVLFSAAVADGLMKQYPDIARVIRRWADHPADSSLVSRLSGDSRLKDMLLQATPWVSDALSDTERMERLVLLLDGRNTRKVIASSVAELKKLFVADRGWCWTSQYPKASEWATCQVLDILGALNRLGWMPDNKELADMIAAAVRYIDSTTASDYRKYPRTDFTSYCYMRLKYPDIKLSSAADAVVKAQVNRIISSWKDHPVVLKGADAQILFANGYQATARRILESLTELATATPSRGMWWEQLSSRYSMWSMDKVGCTSIILDAYSMVSPKAPEIDRIRQWLMLNKTDNSWGNSIVTSQVVASVLVAGSDWTVIPEATAVRVGSTLLEPGEEYATGSFTEEITSLLSSPSELTVDRQGSYPSSGGLITMQVLPMEDVAAVSSDDLSVRKYLTVFDGAKWVPATSFRVGDRVKVVLTIVANADMSYVVVADKRAAALEPKEQLPSPVFSEGLCFYRENRDEQTNLFIDFLPKGTYRLEYELFATQEGDFSSGVAQVQSQYNPLNAAHSEGARISVR